MTQCVQVIQAMYLLTLVTEQIVRLLIIIIGKYTSRLNFQNIRYGYIYEYGSAVNYL